LLTLLGRRIYSQLAGLCHDKKLSLNITRVRDSLRATARGFTPLQQKRLRLPGGVIAYFCILTR
jgi:hypothetical protein